MSSAEPTPEELRAELEEQMRRMSVEDVVLQTVVTLVNLGARRYRGAHAAAKGRSGFQQYRSGGARLVAAAVVDAAGRSIRAWQRTSCRD